MEQHREVFQKHYEDYLKRIGEKDLNEIQQQLNLETKDDCLLVPLFNKVYSVGKNGITDSRKKQPSYGTCIILSQYILRFPQTPIKQNEAWVNFKDF
jgi:hypothetical protein